MLYRQKLKETELTAGASVTVEGMRAEDRFRDDLLEQVKFLAGRVDELSSQVHQQQHAYADLRQAHGDLLSQNTSLRREYDTIKSEHRELQRAYLELEEKYANQKRELETMRDLNTRQTHDLNIAKRMLQEVYPTKPRPLPPRGVKVGGQEKK